MNEITPTISVFTSCKNGGRFLRETLNSILVQTFTDYEIVLIDGGSSDNTFEILKEYEHEKRLRWISEPDNDASDGFRKALSLTKGKYIMCMPVSDGFLNNNWFQQCVDVLENDNEISLVWGMVQFMSEEGGLIHVGFPELFKNNALQKFDYFPFWVATNFHLFEMNYCVRSEVYKSCFPDNNPDNFFDNQNPFIKFDYNFSTKGYLPFFIPVVASYARVHHDSRNYSMAEINNKSVNKYFELIKVYANDVLSGKIKHVFRDGNSKHIRTIEKYELVQLKKTINRHKFFTDNNLFFWGCNEKKNFYLLIDKLEKPLKRIYWKLLSIFDIL